MMWTCSEAVYWRSTSLSPLRQPGAPVQPLRGHRCHVCCGMPADSAGAPPSATQPSLSLHRTQRRRDAPRRGRRRKHHHQAAPVRSCRRLLPLSPAGSQRVGGDWGRPGAPQRTHRTCRMLARMDLPSPQTLWACVRGKSALLNLIPSSDAQRVIECRDCEHRVRWCWQGEAGAAPATSRWPACPRAVVDPHGKAAPGHVLQARICKPEVA